MNFFLWPTKFIFLLLFFFLSSCSTIHYRSQGEIPVYFTGKVGHSEAFKIEGDLDFYFWGNYPSYQLVYLDRLAVQDSLKEVSKLKIEEYLTWKDVLVTLFSLGMYSPRKYRISGLGVRQ